MDVVRSYFEHLAQTPERVDSLLMWTICTLVVWVAMLIYREKIIEGAAGENKMLDTRELAALILCVSFPPILFFAAFFQEELPQWVWWFLAAGVGYVMMGRWVFDWVLALKTGATKVDSSEEPENKNLFGKK